ncbi:MAG: hypothetical protein K9L66_09600 [Spirochaetaceae bacterium]|nr:hypothetical protein [Spirochaetaceae bacterium]MCF7949305.1 hypothetical protein [Spirochaetia bacterium]MCF7951748.1 hypothetical protein [Spirochaetaceae bacterium]
MRYRKLIELLLGVTAFLMAGGGAWAEDTVIGRSVEGRAIEVHRFGSGEKALVLYGGIHGGYEWNTVALTRQLIEYFSGAGGAGEAGGAIPEGVSLYIIPVLNPDGLAAVTDGKQLDEFDPTAVDTTKGRFNARGVDLNRNWDARWEPVSEWRNMKVDAGSRPFSEPETRALRDFVLTLKPTVIVSYHSQANGIYYSGKRDRWEPARSLAQVYSEASGYPIPQGRGLVGYRITGASGGYFYRQGIPEITVELTGRTDAEFTRNVKGVRSLLQAVAEQ